MHNIDESARIVLKKAADFGLESGPTKKRYMILHPNDVPVTEIIAFQWQTLARLLPDPSNVSMIGSLMPKWFTSLSFFDSIMPEWVKERQLHLRLFKSVTILQAFIHANNTVMVSPFSN
jgi:hypothetical protein